MTGDSWMSLWAHDTELRAKRDKDAVKDALLTFLFCVWTVDTQWGLVLPDFQEVNEYLNLCNLYNQFDVQGHETQTFN